MQTKKPEKKHSESLKGKNPWIKGKHHTEETRKKLSKTVYQYTKDGVFVKEWVSAREIGRVLGYDNRNISACCNGKCKSAYGYLWTLEPLN